MPLVKVRARCQVTIPEEVRRRVGLQVGDYRKVEAQGEEIVLIPKRLAAQEEAWFWSEEWQEKEREADEALARGDYKEFSDAEELIRELNS